MVAVFDRTHSAIGVAAMLVAGQVIPALAVPALVARVEASRHRGELTGLYFFEALVTAMLAVLLWHFWLPAVLLLVALDGTAARAANALLRTEIARTARTQARTEAGTNAGGAAEAEAIAVDQDGAERAANAALNVAFSATFVLGPIIAGAMVAGVGAPAALFVDVASFLICGALLTDLRPYVEDAAGESVGTRMRAAWTHISETAVLRRLLLAEAIAFVFFETGAPIEIAYAKVTLHVGARGFGLLLTVWGAGTVLGSLVFARSLRRPLGVLLSAGTFAVGLAYVGFSAAPSLVLAGIAALVGGIGNGTELPSLFSIVQRLTPKKLHGQLMGAVESLSAICPAIGLPLGGALVVLTSPRTAFLIVGLGTAAAATALLGISGVRRATPTGEDAASIEHMPPGTLGGSMPHEPAAK